MTIAPELLDQLLANYEKPERSLQKTYQAAGAAARRSGQIEGEGRGRELP